MEEPSARKDKWVLTQEAFDMLLRWLGPDRERAGQAYESIRLKLLKFFECHGYAYPEDYTDEAINRVARKIAQEEPIATNNPSSYFYGVARMLSMEIPRERKRAQTALNELKARAPISESPYESDQVYVCFEQCLQSLPSDSREWVMEYYQGERGARIARRQKLAERLQISSNALAIRCYEIRKTLAACVEICRKKARG